jgi:hypothetical protein
MTELSPYWHPRNRIAANPTVGLVDAVNQFNHEVPNHPIQYWRCRASAYDYGTAQFGVLEIPVVKIYHVWHVLKSDIAEAIKQTKASLP